MSTASRHEPDAVRLRPAKAADCDAVYRLEMHCFERKRERFNRRQVDYLIRRARGVALIAEADGQVLGWVVGLIRRTRTGGAGARIYAVAVHPDARGLRIGHRMLTRLLGDLARRGVTHEWLEVRSDNTPAIELYRKHGFVEDRPLRHFYGRGVHGVRMARHSRQR